jgi:hypothetical protein
MQKNIEIKKDQRCLLKPSHELLLVIADQVDDLRHPTWQLID